MSEMMTVEAPQTNELNCARQVAGVLRDNGVDSPEIKLVTSVLLGNEFAARVQQQQGMSISEVARDMITQHGGEIAPKANAMLTDMVSSFEACSAPKSASQNSTKLGR